MSCGGVIADLATWDTLTLYMALITMYEHCSSTTSARSERVRGLRQNIDTANTTEERMGGGCSQNA